MFQLQTHNKSNRSHPRGYTVPLVKVQNFLNVLANDSPHLGSASPHQLHLTTMEDDNLPRSDLTTIQWPRHLNVVVYEAKGLGLVEFVVVDEDVEAVADLLQASRAHSACVDMVHTSPRWSRGEGARTGG
jgi:hypothetical protein